MKNEVLSGVLVVDKPIGPTSHDIVYKARGILQTRVGHMGTLDPLASGALPLLLGQATRLLRFFEKSYKVYQAEVELGTSTTTFDREGEVVFSGAVPCLSIREADTVLDQFRGPISQIPPMFSALKVKGEKLYQLARRGETSQRKPRSLVIHQLQLLEKSDQIWQLKVHCSSGTYIRSLAHDIGQVLGCGAHLRNLRRLQCGPFGLDRAVALESIETDWREQYLPIELLLPELPRIDIPQEWGLRVRNGNEIPLEGDHPDGYVRLFSEGRLISIAEKTGDRGRPSIVFAAAR